MKYLFLFTTLLFLSFNGYTQKFTVSGKVTSGESPVRHAAIRVLGTSFGTETNEMGEYSLLLEKGDYVFIFSNGNQKKLSVSVTSNVIINVDMSDASEELQEVFISAVRVSADSPITYSNLKNEEIEDRNLGQDIPSLMQYMPAVVTTSDAGAGIGYSSIRVRGTDARGVNVTINGVPYNDAESQGTFWVNLGDFASSVENLQLQRGVGTSTNGAGAFGASINILTDKYSIKPSAEIANSFGSYDTRKHTVKFSTGLYDNQWEFSGRASVIKSEGYIDRASSDLKSYFFQGAYVGGNSLIKALTFGGSEITYQSWDGIDAETLATDRRFNYAGAYVDESGNLRFYENHVDNYKQDHYQLLWNQKYGAGWSSNIALHYTYGRGFYESYRAGETLSEYGIPNFTVNGEEITESDLVTRKWLDNDFYGATFNLQYEEEKMKLIFGGAWNNYLGDHFGEVIYTRFAPTQSPLQRYYENNSQKSDLNFFGKATLALSENFSFYGDLQVRRVHFEVDGLVEEETPFFVDDEHVFFNPKAGLTYELSESNQLYFSFARAHREPNRTDYENGNPEPEKLNDYELGWRLKTNKVQVNTNLYFMDYQNQLVLTGELDDVGSPIRTNSGNSYRLGLEIDAAIKFSDKFIWRPNVAFSQNKNDDWIANWDGQLVNFGKTDVSYSPEVIAGNIIEYKPIKNLELKFLSKYVGEQYMSNLENKASLLEDYFVNDFNVQYTWQNAPFFKEIVFTGLVNNIFSEEYVSNGYYYTYDIGNETFDGAGYYPQATRNYLAGVTLKF